MDRGLPYVPDNAGLSSIDIAYSIEASGVSHVNFIVLPVYIVWPFMILSPSIVAIGQDTLGISALVTVRLYEASPGLNVLFP